MSTAKFATVCGNPTCAQPLAGPVTFCPYCATPVTSVEPVKPASATKPAAAPAPTRPQAAPIPPTAPEPSKPQPEAAPAAAPRSAEAEAEPAAMLEPAPRKKRGKLPLVVVAVVVVAGALPWLSRTPPPPDLRAARQCLANNDLACARQLAQAALQTHPDDPAAQQLLNQSQSALQQQQALLAERKAQEARLAAELERQRLAAERERLAAVKEQERLKVEAERQASLEAEKQAREKISRPPVSAPMHTNNATQQLLERARVALQRSDYQSAISLGQTAQSLEPGNRLAADLIREAERQKRLALQSTTIE